MFYFLDLINFIYLSLTYDSYYNLLCRFYLHFIIIRKYLLSFRLIFISVNTCVFLYNILKSCILKIRMFIEKDKHFKFLSFEL